jgi:hypothetical protein
MSKHAEPNGASADEAGVVQSYQQGPVRRYKLDRLLRYRSGSGRLPP